MMGRECYGNRNPADHPYKRHPHPARGEVECPVCGYWCTVVRFRRHTVYVHSARGKRRGWQSVEDFCRVENDRAAPWAESPGWNNQ